MMGIVPYLFIFYNLFLQIANAHVSLGHSHIVSPGLKSEVQNDANIDEQLYSRQIAVYGKSAQQQLLNAHIVIYGSGSLTAEVLKNLALAGIGKISVIENTETRVGPSTYLKGLEKDLVSYARSLNSQISVSHKHKTISCE